jgi:hypothetical protein
MSGGTWTACLATFWLVCENLRYALPSRAVTSAGGRSVSGMFTIGESVRRARVELLERGNPLGLVYIPFAVSGLQLVEQI